MTKEKALYQVKLILDYLPYEEFCKIPEETLEYIEQNMEYSPEIQINPEKPLEEQEIDEKVYEILEEIIKKVENPPVKIKNNKTDILNNLDKNELINLLEKYRKENLKILKARELINEYRQTIEKKDKEINKLKEANEELYNSLKKCPKLIRKIFLKTFNNKLLKE